MKNPIAIVLVSMLATAAYADKDRGGGHYVQDCSGMWITLDEYRLSNPEKEFDIKTDPDTKDAAKIVFLAIENLSKDLPSLGETISRHLSQLRWVKSCQPLKILDDSNYSTPEKLNIIQGAIQDVKRNTIVWGEVENKGKSDIVKTRLMAHEILLNTFGDDVPRGYLARASKRFMEYANQSSQDPWPVINIIMRSRTYKKGSRMYIQSAPRKYVSVLCVVGQPCDVAMTFTYEDIGDIQKVIFSFNGAFGDFEVLENNRLIHTEPSTDEWDLGNFKRKDIIRD